jgi:hypothetical protein
LIEAFVLTREGGKRMYIVRGVYGFIGFGRLEFTADMNKGFVPNLPLKKLNFNFKEVGSIFVKTSSHMPIQNHGVLESTHFFVIFHIMGCLHEKSISLFY